MVLSLGSQVFSDIDQDRENKKEKWKTEGEKGLLAIMSLRCDYSSRQRGLGLKDILVTQ